jgi:hypothetical protein
MNSFFLFLVCFVPSVGAPGGNPSTIPNQSPPSCTVINEPLKPPSPTMVTRLVAIFHETSTIADNQVLLRLFPHVAYGRRCDELVGGVVWDSCEEEGSPEEGGIDGYDHQAIESAVAIAAAGLHSGSAVEMS